MTDMTSYLGTGSAFFDTVLGGGGGAGCEGAGYTLGWVGWKGDLGATLGGAFFSLGMGCEGGMGDE